MRRGTFHSTLRLVTVICVCGYGLVALILGVRWAGFGWNFTESAPIGLYTRDQEPRTRGQLVYFCLPREVAQIGGQRGYIARVPWWSLLRECPSGYQPLLKHVVAVAGDVVEVNKNQVRIGKRTFPNSATQAHDSQGRKLEHTTWGQFQLLDGELWVMSTEIKNSWDSRYFGVVREEWVLGTARPWLVWPTTAEAQQ